MRSYFGPEALKVSLGGIMGTNRGGGVSLNIFWESVISLNG